MPYANNGGIRIYYETEGGGPPMVLVHGFSDSLEGWREYGYTEELEKRRHLILIDARGHGASDKPHDPEAYGLEQRPADVVAVLDDLGIDKADYLGYSLGGWIGLGLAKYAPGRRPGRVRDSARAVRNTRVLSWSKPTGIVRLAFRLPVYLYHANLGWLLGHRFLLLTHRGRTSGRARRTVLEVLRYDPVTRESVVVSAWGEDSDWYRNLRATPAMEVRIGREHYAPA